MPDITSSFNEIKIDGENNKIYIGSKDKFEPDTEWFNNQNSLAIKDLGARYTPEINIELESLLENFDALSRNEQFKKRVDSAYHEFMVSYRDFLGHIYFTDEQFESSKNELTTLLESFEEIYETIEFLGSL